MNRAGTSGVSSSGVSTLPVDVADEWMAALLGELSGAGAEASSVSTGVASSSAFSPSFALFLSSCKYASAIGCGYYGANVMGKLEKPGQMGAAQLHTFLVLIFLNVSPSMKLTSASAAATCAFLSSSVTSSSSPSSRVRTWLPRNRHLRPCLHSPVR